MKEIVPINSELVSVIPEDTFVTKYEELKGLAIDMRTAAEKQGPPEASFGAKNPELTMIGSLAISQLGIEAIYSNLIDAPDIVQGGTGLAVFAGIIAKFRKDLKAQQKYIKRKEAFARQDIFAIAENDPNVYILPRAVLRLDIEEGETLTEANHALFRTPQGRKTLEAMYVDPNHETSSK